MKKYFFLWLLSLAGCSTTTTLQFEKSTGKPNKKGVDFEITVSNGPSSKFTKYFSNGLCGLDAEVTITKIYDGTEWDSYSKILFSNSNDEQSFAILLHFNNSTGQIQSLIKHSQDDGAESLDKNFDVNQELTLMVYFDKNEMGIAIEPASKMKKLVEFKSSGHSENFEFSVVNIGFKPEQVSFYGVSSDTNFKSVNFREGC